MKTLRIPDHVPLTALTAFFRGNGLRLEWSARGEYTAVPIAPPTPARIKANQIKGRDK